MNSQIINTIFENQGQTKLVGGLDLECGLPVENPCFRLTLTSQAKKNIIVIKKK